MADDGDVEMADGAGSSGISPSPFALLNPKLELTASPPRVTQPIKPKFQPKVKPRPGARGRIEQPAQTKPKAEPGKIVPKAGRSVLEDDEEFLLPKMKKNLSPAAEVALITPKAESNVPKKESVKKEALSATLLLNVKDEVPAEENSKLEPEATGNFSDFLGVHGLKEEHVGVKEEALGLEDEFLGDAPSLGGGDRVVREIDVFLTPNVDAETQLYLMQYPLRPQWRPYGLEERCQEVRIKPQQSKFEVDLYIDTESNNYEPDREPHLQITKQEYVMARLRRRGVQEDHDTLKHVDQQLAYMTLASSKVPMTTGYAIGILRGNQLHLNPVQAVVQFRPSMKYIDDNDAAKKKSNKEAGITDGEDEEMEDAEPSDSKAELTLVQVNIRRRETERQEATRLQSHAYLKQLDEAEEWIPLEPHGTDSPVTEGIRQKMIASTNDKITFDMCPDVYIDTLVPGRASTNTVEILREDGSGNAEFSRSYLDSLSLEGRLDELLTRGRVQVFTFDRLMKLAPTGCTEDVLLDLLQQKAVLVQGCWVGLSGFRYDHPLSLIRDYILFQFSKNRVVLHEHLRGLPVTKDDLRGIMIPIAVQRGATGWEFQEDTERSFIKKHQAIVKQQADQWAEAAETFPGELKAVKFSLSEIDRDEPMEVSVEEKRPHKKVDNNARDIQQRSAPASTSSRPPSGRSQGSKASAAADGGHVENGDVSGRVTMSEATQAALPGALREIFLRHNVCSMQIICQSLRDMAIERTATSSNPKAAAAAVAAAKGANAPLAELTAAVNRVATSIDGVYFLTKLNNPALDPFRGVVIDLLRGKGPNTGLRRTDLMMASKMKLGIEVPSVTYQKVMKELCYTKGAAWVLKPGDGRPP